MAAICGMRVRVTGLENIPAGPCIVASKHQSAFDTFVWLTLLPHPVYVMKQELLRLPGWGALARRFGAVGVDRAGGAAALKSMVRQSREFAERDRAQLVIFPEGTRTAPGERVPWQPGVAALASAPACRWCRRPRIAVASGDAAPLPSGRAPSPWRSSPPCRPACPVPS